MVTSSKYSRCIFTSIKHRDRKERAVDGREWTRHADWQSMTSLLFEIHRRRLHRLALFSRGARVATSADLRFSARPRTHFVACSPSHTTCVHPSRCSSPYLPSPWRTVLSRLSQRLDPILLRLSYTKKHRPSYCRPWKRPSVNKTQKRHRLHILRLFLQRLTAHYRQRAPRDRLLAMAMYCPRNYIF